ncbi:MAG TPA: histidine phosphatase family protein [Tepidisphaeraceae bacterium]|jgi:probable phosphoglycerate mutase|nr:histidine phosphatase family protein [Tepidisphaeraceae bacterium]
MKPIINRLPLPVLALLSFILGCAGPDWTEKPAPRTATTRILLVRHGEALVNLPHPADASPDSLDQLTPRGLGQADAAANRIRGQSVALVVTSPARRARETAGAIAARLYTGNPPVSDDAFAPLPPGGASASSMMRGPTTQDSMVMAAPDAQSRDAAVDRARQAIDRLSQQHPGQTILIVTHGDVIASLIGHEVPVGSISQIDVNHGSQLAAPSHP